ncbi:hypothetical protein Taro_021884 [Colocasia esculenta]|uniref:Uncharacterized protein n=1 Tax=Colocasia esculenta TaxID=4460 RepID=A0A843USS8_COLES|nr:hypothetical protein [Colocasia esculenta]
MEGPCRILTSTSGPRRPSTSSHSFPPLELGAGVPVVFFTRTGARREEASSTPSIQSGSGYHTFAVIKRENRLLPRSAVLVEEERTHIPARSPHAPKTSIHAY